MRDPISSGRSALKRRANSPHDPDWDTGEPEDFSLAPGSPESGPARLDEPGSDKRFWGGVVVVALAALLALLIWHERSLAESFLPRAGLAGKGTGSASLRSAAGFIPQPSPMRLAPAGWQSPTGSGPRAPAPVGYHRLVLWTPLASDPVIWRMDRQSRQPMTLLECTDAAQRALEGGILATCMVDLDQLD